MMMCGQVTLSRGQPDRSTPELAPTLNAGYRGSRDVYVSQERTYINNKLEVGTEPAPETELKERPSAIKGRARQRQPLGAPTTLPKNGRNGDQDKDSRQGTI
jgi:hypothetical protein